MPNEMAEFLLDSIKSIYSNLIVHLQDSEIDIQQFYSTNPDGLVKKLLSIEKKKDFNTKKSASILTKDDKLTYTDKLIQEIDPSVKLPQSTILALNLQRRLVLQLEKMFFGFLDLTLQGQLYKWNDDENAVEASNCDA